MYQKILITRMNRRMIYLDKINPEVAFIRKTSFTNIERGWGYIKLLLEKNNLQNSPTEIWLNKKYHFLEENQFIQSLDTRPIAGGLVYLGGILTGEKIPKNEIIKIMKPMTEEMLNEKIEDLKNWLTL